MLAKVNAHNIKLLLYELLNSIETNKGHVALAKQYRTQYINWLGRMKADEIPNWKY